VVSDAIGLTILLCGLLFATGNFRTRDTRALKQRAPAASKHGHAFQPERAKLSV